MEQLQHFSREHLLSLVQLQPHNNNENFDKEEEDENEDKDDIVVEEEGHIGKCKMCEEEIYWFHLCYYCCKDCDYCLHKFCAQLPKTQQTHPLHPGHNLTLSQRYQFHDPDLSEFLSNSIGTDTKWICDICNIYKTSFYNYHCSICKFDIDIICATMSEQNMNHPSHPHQLQRYLRQMISGCSACGNVHTWTFYHCKTCSWFMIHVDCALLQAKIRIQQYTNDSFSHCHLLTLAYSFPYIERKAEFFPRCRVCEKMLSTSQWHYRCYKCLYFIHVDCATSKGEAFMSSILMPAGTGKTYKNYKDDEHPNLIRYPFHDESANLLMHLFINKGELVLKRKINGERFSHLHPLILVDTLFTELVYLHDIMKNVELLCDGCV